MCVELIKNLVESEFNLQLKRKTRRREYIEARAMYYMLLREKGRMTVSSISKTLDKNHATILHALKNLHNWMTYDTNIKSIYDSLEEKVNKIMLLHPEEFEHASTEEKFYLSAYVDLENKMIEQEELHKKIFDDMESKYRTLRGRYRFLLFKLRNTSPETYRTFKELETNDI